ncbi:MAG: NAD(P)H-binding protein [Lewinella sp.]|nr:NAD(P)H-binding protein [Lewinella sp.]
MPTALILGATGLVGKSLLPLLLEAEEFTTVKAISRRPTGIDHPKLEEVLIDFDQPEQWQALVEGNVLFSTFGTTLAQAGSKEAQYKVDFTYQYQVAEAAASHGATDYVLVSTLGASPGSPFFYPRIRGQLDQAVRALPFERIRILKPSVLVGERPTERTGESWSIRIMSALDWVPFIRKYRPIPGEVVARAMLAAYRQGRDRAFAEYELEEVFELAGE